MAYFLEGLRQALKILFPPSREVLEIVGLSLFVSASATALAAVFAAPLGVFLSLVEFRGRRLVIGLLQTALAVPAVLIGLVAAIMDIVLFKQYAEASADITRAKILAQALLAFPIIAALTLAALKDKARDGRDLAYALGASRGRMLLTILRQGRFAFLAAMVAGFSRVLGETGMTLMVGGNIKGATRVMTTAISLETMKGNFEIGIAHLAAQYTQMRFAAQKIKRHFFGSTGRNVYLYTRIAQSKAGRQLGQYIFPGGCAAGNPKFPRNLLQGRHHGLEIVSIMQKPARPWHKELASLGQLQAGAAPNE